MLRDYCTIQLAVYYEIDDNNHLQVEKDMINDHTILHIPILTVTTLIFKVQQFHEADG